MNEIKDRIERLEELRNGLNHLNGAYAEARNIRILKNKVIADVLLVFPDENKTERYNDCEYPFGVLHIYPLRTTEE